jgi:hypothetical protein
MARTSTRSPPPDPDTRCAAAGAGLLAWLAWIALCLACARPQQLGEPIAPPQVGRDLMLAVDLSGSMSEEDMELGGQVVDRLTAAKAVLADFLDRPRRRPRRPARASVNARTRSRR